MADQEIRISESKHYRLLATYYEKILSGELTSFADIARRLNKLAPEYRCKYVYLRLFNCLKELRWGFFRTLNPAAYPDLWKALVVPHPDYPDTGDLKRNMTITTLFTGLVDIHGYTRFCQKAGRNTSMLHLLDQCIDEDIGQIARENGVMSRRERGDELVIIGAQASSVLKTIISIADYFQKKKVITSRNLSQSRKGYKVILPNMAISGGISGGQKYTPLIITTEGAVSGHLINSAARLQNRANKLAPSSTKLLISSHAYMAIQKEEKLRRQTLFNRKEIFFRNTGKYDFKGTSVTVVEVIFQEGEQYKRLLDAGLQELRKSLKKGLWRQQIFVDTVTLLSRTLESMPPFRITKKEGHRIGNKAIGEQCESAIMAYVSRHDYQDAVEKLEGILALAENVPDFDAIILEYSRGVCTNYRTILDLYTCRIEEVLTEKMEYMLPSELKSLYRKAESNQRTIEKLREAVMQKVKTVNRKSCWFQLLDEHQDTLGLRLYSGK